MLGSRVVRGTRVFGGYSPSPTFRLLTETGGKAFLKAVYAGSTEFAREAFQTELRNYRGLHSLLTGWTPIFLGDFVLEGWSVMLLSDVGPKSVPPWKRSVARDVLRQLAEFHAVGADQLLPEWLPTFEHYVDALDWEKQAAKTDGYRVVASFCSPFESDALDWWACHRSELAEISSQVKADEEGQTLLHGDFRSDNLRFVAGGLKFFDLPAMLVGHPAWEVVPFCHCVALESGMSPEELLSWYQDELPMTEKSIDAAPAFFVGFFADRGFEPEIDGLPRLRKFQRQQLGTLVQWASRRFGWGSAEWARGLLR